MHRGVEVCFVTCQLEAPWCLVCLQCNTYLDFKHEKTMLQWVALGHKDLRNRQCPHRVIYGVIFHCVVAVVDAVWAYMVAKHRPTADGKATTLVSDSELVRLLAFDVKPDVVLRLLNRPTEAMQL